MGSPADEPGRDDIENQHRVRLSRGFWLGRTEVTQGEWQTVMGRSLSAHARAVGKDLEFVYNEGRDWPMYQVSWDEAVEYCRKLTERERAAGRLPVGWVYRLPTEAQWEYACRAGSRGAVYTGGITIRGDRNVSELDAIAWYGGNSSVGYSGKGSDSSGWPEKQHAGDTSGPRKVGQKRANAWGFQDMLGNVYEWTSNWYGDYPSGTTVDPRGPSTGDFRGYRGGSWFASGKFCRSAYRGRFSPGFRTNLVGFRVAAVPSNPATVVDRPILGVGATDAFAGTRAGQVRKDNELSMSLAWCPVGAFTMGSPVGEVGREEDEAQVRVQLDGYWLGAYEVTQGQWKAVMGTDPSEFKGADLPVEQVIWNDSVTFCRKLTESERRSRRLPAGWEYRLPSEAQWEYACRAGTTTATSFGNNLSSNQANLDGNNPYGGAEKGPYLKKTTRGGSYRANAWGLYDMHGNVWEWCADEYSERLPGGRNPLLAIAGFNKVMRSGGWLNHGQLCRSANRFKVPPGFVQNFIGFRVAAVPSDPAK